MRTFFYFVPDANTLTPDGAAKLGLAYAFERGIDCAQVERGPEGLKGIVVAQQDSYVDGQLGYHADKQTWREIPNPSPPSTPPATRLFVGHYNDQLPTPEDLARKKQLDGAMVALADEHSWLLPLARTYGENEVAGELEIFWQKNLPQRLELAADGRWITSGVLPRYACLWELAEAWMRVRSEAATEADREQFRLQGQIEAAILCLQANYRLGRVEASVLGLLTDELIISILDQLIDMPTWQSLTKKKRARSQAAMLDAGASLSDGLAAKAQTTGQPLPT